MPRLAHIPDFTPEDLEKINTELNKRHDNFMNSRNLAIVALLLKTGLKTRFITDVNAEDYDWKTGYIKPHLEYAPNIVSLDRQTRSILDHYLSFRKDMHKPLFVAELKYVDKLSKYGLRLTNRSIQRILQGFGKRLRLSVPLNPKSIRHLVGMYYASTGASNVTISSIMGNVAPYVITNYRVKNNSRYKTNAQVAMKQQRNYFCEIHRINLIAVGTKNGITTWICTKEGCTFVVTDKSAI